MEGTFPTVWQNDILGPEDQFSKPFHPLQQTPTQQTLSQNTPPPHYTHIEHVNSTGLAATFSGTVPLKEGG